MSDHLHDLDRLHDLADGRLSDVEGAAVRAEVAECAACRRELAAIEAAKTAAATLRVERPVPAGLEAAIHQALDTEGQQPTVSGWPRQWSRRRMLIGLAASVAVVVALRWRRAKLDPVASALDTEQRIADGSLRLARQSSSPAELETYFESVGQPVRVIDLSAMALTLQGGLRHDVGGTPSALYTYRSPAGELLVCQMFEGSVDALPAADAARATPEFRFFVFVRQGITSVFWQEGDIVCVLTSRLPTNDVVDLAAAKAMAPA